ncbi:hypothetical protein B0H19DRAFT_1060312 [Mycena capillaripes]|nr:hypothetical protein B0H19DRAFT_1060312 [Mycena capillaripes]
MCIVIRGISLIYEPVKPRKHPTRFGIKLTIRPNWGFTESVITHKKCGRAESISEKNACCKRMEPAAKPQNDANMRWGCLKVLVVLLGESWRWKCAEETGCGSSTKTRTVSARSLLRGPPPRQRCGGGVRRD